MITGDLKEPFKQDISPPGLQHLAQAVALMGTQWEEGKEFRCEALKVMLSRLN